MTQPTAMMIAHADQCKVEGRVRTDQLLEVMRETLAQCACPEQGLDGPVHTRVILSLVRLSAQEHDKDQVINSLLLVLAETVSRLLTAEAAQ